MRKITGDIKISDLVEQFPTAVNYLVTEYQFHCVNCFVSDYETLEEGAKVHGIEGEDFVALLEELNEIDGTTGRNTNIPEAI